jgi:TM2 domain-containing membrane protein YozV/ribosomal protein L40E
MSEPSTTESDRTRGPDEAFCRDCGAVIDAQAEICPECGVRQLPPPQSSVDSAIDDLFEGGNPFVAAALSALFPGLGQIYNRELEKGIAFIVGGFLAVLSALVLVGFVLYPAVWIYSIYEAYKTAERQASERKRVQNAGVEDNAAETTGDDAVDATDTTDTVDESSESEAPR